MADARPKAARRLRAAAANAAAISAAACLGILSAGCTGRPVAGEREARADLDAVASRYRPGDSRPALPALTADSPLPDYLRYSMTNSPEVETAYYAWAAAVARITSARSLPDPALTFEADIADTVLTLMPGLMIDLPGPGKLRASGDAAVAQSQRQYFVFESRVLRTALAVKTAYYRLWFLEESLRVERETLRLLSDIEQLAQQQNAAGRVTLQDVLRAQIEREQTQTRIANLEDSQHALVAELKSALGIPPGEPDPPVPARFEPSAGDPDADAILAAALSRNPALRAVEADVLRAEASLDLARKAGVPDFSLGVEGSVISPMFVRPKASMTLPIWRDKIAAEIAAAQAERRSAEAQLSAEQIRLAAELAAMLFAYRESVRNARLLLDTLIPNARQSLDAARAGYVVGRSSFLDLIDAQRSLLSFELFLVEARTQRELALASLSLSIAGLPPEGAPVLDQPEEPP